MNRKENLASPLLRCLEPPGVANLSRFAPHQTAARTSRLTENKRRYRARRKEYVSDLEERLAQANRHGVQATKEVQLAAQQVQRENAQLRDLLILTGFSQEEISAWLGPPGCARRACGKKASGYATGTHRDQDHISGESATQAQRLVLPQVSEPRDRPAKSADGLPSEHVNKSSSRLALGDKAKCHKPHLSEGTASQQEDPPGAGASAESTKPPCKLLSRLEQNPGADLTQVPFTPSGPDEVPPSDTGMAGVECNRAYEMLMRFGTTDDKVDRIAQALEGGCTLDGRGSCAVKREAIWEVLDEMCG